MQELHILVCQIILSQIVWGVCGIKLLVVAVNLNTVNSR